ncbi:MAG: M14 family metallocarboxypeptidase [Puniceicoccales bacterium]|jgi:hypothetical protein|nr:M14 family metallocarboxypeptidase [Puniceicoccales bacterium]
MNSAANNPRFDPAAFARRFVAAASNAGFGVVEYGTAGGFPLLAAEHTPPEPKLSLHISAGIHGDEPAGALALLALMSKRWFDLGLAWHILPLLNPTGTAANTRENAAGIDLNRDYRDARAPETRAHIEWLRRNGRRYDASLSLHEDWEAKGFYLYEMGTAPVNDGGSGGNGGGSAVGSTAGGTGGGVGTVSGAPLLGWSILQSVEPVCGIDNSPEIDGFPANNGLLQPHAQTSLEAVETWPEQLFLRARYAALSLTFETPSALPIDTRILAQIIAIKTTVNLLLAPKIIETFDI